MRGYLTLLFQVSILLLLTGCSTGDAELVADTFHEKLDAKAYKYIVDNLVDEEILEDTGEEAWFDLFSFIDETWGTITSRSKDTGFNSSYNNGETSVQLNYTNLYGDKTVYERLYLINRDKEYKLTGILVNESKAGLEEAAADF